MDNRTMPPLALALVLAAALLHATWNVLAKHAGGDHRFSFIASALVALVWLPVALGVGLGDVAGWGWRAWLAVGASAVVHVLYFNVLLIGYRRSDLTIVYPVARGTGPLLSSLLAVLLMGESVTVLSVAGVIAVCAGIVLVAGGLGLWARRHDRGEHGAATRSRAISGLRWGAATGALIAAYTVIDGYAVKVLLLSPVVVDYIGNLLRVPMQMPAALRDRGALRAAWQAQWKHALAVAVLSPLAYILVLYAVRMAPLSHVAPAREVSMLFASLVGGKLLGEGDRVARGIGALFVALGVACLAWA